MQCIWTSTANVLRRQKQPWRTFPAPIRVLTQSRNLSWTKWTQRTASTIEKRDLSSVATSFVSTAIRDTTIPPAAFTISEDPSHDEGESRGVSQNDESFSPAKLSRIAAQAVRVACREPSTREAFLIIKSLLKSEAFYSKPRKPGSQFPKSVPIDFGVAVSPRLATHSLLHGLIRRGTTKDAGDIARRILLHEPNLRLSDRTLRAITTALCQTDAVALQDQDFRSQLQKAKAHFGDYLSRPTEVTKSRVRLPCTSLAMQLYFSAKQYRKQREKQMFQQLIDACLLQGEILIATFLFAFLAKAAHSRLLPTAVMSDEPASPSDGGGTPPVPTPSFKPKLTFLNATLSYIRPIITEDILPNPRAIRPSHEEAVQALAMLAKMLREGSLQHNGIGGLVKALVQFDPSDSVAVWTLRKGKKKKWERRLAHEYFDEVLDELIDQVTDPSYGKSERERKERTRTMRARMKRKKTYWAKVETYNSLVYYAFMRKKSPALAERVIKHMKTVGGRLNPNITTYNIVLGSGTALRRHDITSRVLQTLREMPENAGHAIMFAPPERGCRERVRRDVRKDIAVTQANDSSLEPTDQAVSYGRAVVPAIQESSSDQIMPAEVLGRLSPDVQRVFLEKFDPELLSSSTVPLPADGVTLAAYLNYLTASGHVEAAVKLVLTLIPEIKGGSYPHGIPTPPRVLQKTPFNRHNAISRAVLLGPLFFTEALHAVVKAGRTGLAERTWRLAKTAEECTWGSGYDVQPWILPCAAYTIMMEAYGMEARKAYRSVQHPFLGISRRGQSERIPFGWGALSILRRRATKQSAHALEVARDMGAYILRSQRMSEAVYRARLTAHLEAGGSMLDGGTVQMPVADERFYNAALYLFGRVPGSYIPTRKKLSPRRLRRLQRRQLDIFMQRGFVGFLQDSKLTSVLGTMGEAGYDIPLAYRHMLVGIDVPPQSHRAARLDRNGYASRVGIAGTTRLSTVKTRGLPVSNSLKVGRRKAS